MCKLNPTYSCVPSQVHQGKTGREMAESEYKATKMLFNIMPEMVAEPMAWGAYKDLPDTWFYLCRYYKLSGGLPDLFEFPKLLAEMHRRGSRTGNFGLDQVTYGGRNPKYFPPSRTWEETFSKGLQKTFEREEDTQGPDENMQRLRDVLMTKVVPRLLRPLEIEGRTIAPTLVHGDLWDGNASVDENTGHPIIFDATPLYAHNECTRSVLSTDTIT